MQYIGSLWNKDAAGSDTSQGTHPPSESSAPPVSVDENKGWDWLSSVSTSFKESLGTAASTFQEQAIEAIEDIKDTDLNSWFGETSPSNAGCLPWEGRELFTEEIEGSNYNNEEVLSEMKIRVLRVGADPATFSSPPPPSFEFSLREKSTAAAALLKADEELAQQRFKLVPRLMKEEAFWGMYFWKLSDCIEHLKQDILENRLSGDVVSSKPPTEEVTKNDARDPAAPRSPASASAKEHRGGNNLARKNSLDEALKEFESSPENSDEEKERSTLPKG
eukprot:GHVN01034276.1.p3 GENE.GHVN01034276.1~~GHVN01034276.1.p3  ORF type:complete len:277 (+),score=52.13 GHVN01034276.1:2966-3796(+)